MKRHEVVTRSNNDGVTIEFHEMYQAGSKVTVDSHSLHWFVSTDQRVTHHLVVSKLSALAAEEFGKKFLFGRNDLL